MELLCLNNFRILQIPNEFRFKRWCRRRSNAFHVLFLIEYRSGATRNRHLLLLWMRTHREVPLIRDYKIARFARLNNIRIHSNQSTRPIPEMILRKVILLDLLLLIINSIIVMAADVSHSRFREILLRSQLLRLMHRIVSHYWALLLLLLLCT